MNTQQYDDTTSFLLRHNYIVKCVINQNNDIVCNYNNVFEIKYKINHLYQNQYNLAISYYADTERNTVITENMLLPSYVLRWFIFLDILRICRKHKLSYNIIRFFDTDNNIKDLTELLNIDMTEVDMQIESMISKSVTEILKDKNTINKFDKEYVANGTFYYFNIIKGLLI